MEPTLPFDDALAPRPLARGFSFSMLRAVPRSWSDRHALALGLCAASLMGRRIFLPIVRRGGIAQFFAPTRIPRERAAGLAVELCSLGADKPKIEAVYLIRIAVES
jgi:hypothetical protein